MSVLEDSSFSSCSCAARRPTAAAAWQHGPAAAAAAVAAAQRPRATITGLSHHEPRHLRQCAGAPRSASRLHISTAAPAPPRQTRRPRFGAALALVLLALLLFCECASAAGTQTDRQRLRALARRGEIVYDRSAPPNFPQRMPLLPRAASSDGSHSSALPTTIAPTRSAAGATATTVAVDTSSTATSIPQPFDTSLGSNFTASSCPEFFNTFLENSTFINCVPLSLLLQTSSAFFDATRSVVRTTQVLDASCAVNFGQCNALMNHFAAELTKDDNCGADYQASNPTVLQAYKGLVAYAPSYQAGCQRDKSGSYCFANAITNSSSPTDSYPYYLPLGVALPGGSRPTCNSCLQTTMDSFWTFTSNKTQPISETYTQAAQQINIQCGPNFVNATVATATTGGAAALGAHPGLSSAALLVALFAFFF